MKDKIILPPYMLNPLHPVNIHVVGCGGTGSRVLSELVKVDIALKAKEHPGIYVTAFDPDHVSSENMARQMFYEDDLNMNKAEVLITRINQNYGLQWNACGKKYQDGIDRGANIIMCCLDKAQERIDVINSVRGNKRDFFMRGDMSTLYLMFDFGNGKDFGQIILSYMYSWDPKEMSKVYKEILPTVDKIFREMPAIPKDDEGPSCSLAIALARQSLFINGTLALLGVNWLYDILLKGYIDKRAIYFNLTNLELNSEDIVLPPPPPPPPKKKGRKPIPSCMHNLNPGRRNY